MYARMRRPARTAAAVLLIVTLATACSQAAQGGAGERARPHPSRLTSNGASAVSSVTEEDIATMRVARIEELLMGRVPGLTVLRLANGDYSLRIRGRASFRGDDEPLIVIDGMPIRQGGGARALMTIDPRDVARIDVLKDAGALAMYGSQGGNGVIEIRTRRGRQ